MTIIFQNERNIIQGICVLKMRPEIGETTVTYATRLREKVHGCDFGTNNIGRILEHLIQMIENISLIQECISKAWALQEFLSEAGQIENILLQLKDIKAGSDERGIARIEEPDRQRDKVYRYSDDRGMKTNTRFYRNRGFEAHPHRKRCPAYGKKCNNCSWYNHFASLCRSNLGSKKGG